MELHKDVSTSLRNKKRTVSMTVSGESIWVIYFAYLEEDAYQNVAIYNLIEWQCRV